LRISRLIIKNFRGVKYAELFLPEHAVLIGDNNTGKTTVLEAIDLVLGPDRIFRVPPVNEHDFFDGIYLIKKFDDSKANTEDTIGADKSAGKPELEVVKIEIEVTIIDLNADQQARFGNYIEFWDTESNDFYEEAKPAGVDSENINEAIRVSFIGEYDVEEDDFLGKTYFTRSLTEEERPQHFTKKDKQVCGFLYLRSLRTGSRALSLERGSLLDIIFRVKELRPQMWESILDKLSSFSVASDPELGIIGVLESINISLKKYVPKEWGGQPHLRISSMTREHLRKVITAFISTGDGEHSAPFYRQGTGTINMLVLAMLSIIAEDKQNVIFAMEEPETAVPPYAQKRIVDEIKHLSSQNIFTSHSPYVLEEFSLNDTVVLTRDEDGHLHQSKINLPNSIKPKRYRQEFRTRFCEGLLARRILIAEGATEAAVLPAACRKLSELNPEDYVSLEALGICTIDAGGDTNIPDLSRLYKDLNKEVYTVCDMQTEENLQKIEPHVQTIFMHNEKGFEDLILENTTTDALERFANLLVWPKYILSKYPDPILESKEALRDYFKNKKAEWAIVDFIAQCFEPEIPDFLKNTCRELKAICEASE
jgi:putative ATP-dependent endonuclease of OLD family